MEKAAVEEFSRAAGEAKSAANTSRVRFAEVRTRFCVVPVVREGASACWTRWRLTTVAAETGGVEDATSVMVGERAARGMEERFGSSRASWGGMLEGCRGWRRKLKFAHRRVWSFESCGRFAHQR